MRLLLLLLLVYPTTQETGCLEEHMTDYNSYGVPGQSNLPVAGLDSCTKLCLDLPACHYWTFSPTQKRCWLKTSNAGKRAWVATTDHQNLISGTKACGSTDVGCQKRSSNGVDYGGKANTSTSGAACKKWSDSRKQFVGDHNYCRNPDDMDGGVWCYRVDGPPAWEYCDVPFCEDCTSSLQIEVKANVFGNNDFWKASNTLQLDDSKWLAEKADDQMLKLKFQKCHRMVHGVIIQNSGHNTAAGRRDTRGFQVTGAQQLAGPWEVLVEEELEDLAGTPPVLTFYFSPRNLRFLRFHLLSYWGAGGGLRYFYPITDWFNCQWRSTKGSDYQGEVSTTVDGDTCQQWALDDPEEHKNNDVGEHNYCRNPDDEDGVWCYSTNTGTRWQLCDVPFCEDGVEESPPQCQWSEWSTCPEYCGSSPHISTRTYEAVHSSLPANSKCVGKEERNCTQPCKEPHELGPWTDTDSCTEKCGDQGLIIQTRTCTAIDQTFDCSTLDKNLTERVGNTSCNRRECLVFGNWTDTENCTEGCGDQGLKIQTRNCTAIEETFDCSTLDKNLTERVGYISCNRRDCLELGDWTDTGSCTKECGGGVQVQERDCTDHNETDSCDDQEKVRNIPCNTDDCPLNAGSSCTTTTQVGACSTSCGQGVWNRTSIVGGEMCQERGVTSKLEYCRPIHPCPDVCVYGEWTRCEHFCGMPPKVKQTRKVLVSSISNALPCDEVEKPCSQDISCEEPYKCSSWSPTSTCSESCGNGRYLETRSCLPVHPEIPEELLASPPVTIKDGSSPCSQSPCTGQPGLWGLWSKCQANCSENHENGRMFRTRNVVYKNRMEVEVQEVQCPSPCPPDCTMIGVTMDQTNDGAWYELKTNMSRPKLATVSSIIMVVTHGDAARTKAASKVWPLTANSGNHSIAEIVETVTSEENQKIKLDCDGCNTADAFCHCSINGISFQNTFKTYILLQTPQGTQWCDTETTSSDMFRCDKSEQISVTKLCDGRWDCPGGQDESRFICHPLNLSLYSVATCFTIFFLSLSLAVYYATKGRKELGIVRVKPLTISSLKLLKEYVLNPNKYNEDRLMASIRRMTMKAKVQLLKTTYTIDLQGKEACGQLMKTAVRKVFTTDSQLKELLAFVKASKMPTSFKTRVIDLVKMGCTTKTKAMIEENLPSKVKTTILMVVGVTKSVVGLLLVPFGDIKDLNTMGSLMTFYYIIIQTRTNLIDNMPLGEIVGLLCGIFVLMFILKMVNSLQEKPTMDEPRCIPSWIPFFSQCFLSIRQIQEKWQVFMLELAIEEQVTKITKGMEPAEENKAWEEICSKSAIISKHLSNIEELSASKKQIKLVSILGDIIQGMILMNVLLRNDLRIRSVLQTGSFSEKMGIDVEGSLLLVLILLWNITSPAFRVRGFTSGHKASLLSAGGVLLSLSYISSLSLHLCSTTFLSYASIFITPLPLVILATANLLSKSYFDQTFRNWPIGRKVTFCLLAAIFPVSTPDKKEAKEDNDEDESTTSVFSRKLSGAELTFHHLLHSINFCVCAGIFAYLNFANAEFKDNMMKIKAANGIDPVLLVFIGGPVSMVCSVVFRLLHNYCSPWSLIHGAPPASCTCPLLPISSYQEIDVTDEQSTNNPVAEVQEILEFIADSRP